MTYFSLFSLPETYQLDQQLLVSRYQELQRHYHPDRFAAAAESEQITALQQAATINEAYQTLKHPLKRAEYLLILHGIDVTAEQKTLQDVVFLTEQLTLREELDQIEHSADSELLLQTFAEHITSMVTLRREQLESELAQQQWEQSADTVRKLRFLDKLQQQIEQIEERLLDE